MASSSPLFVIATLQEGFIVDAEAHPRSVSRVKRSEQRRFDQISIIDGTDAVVIRPSRRKKKEGRGQEDKKFKDHFGLGTVPEGLFSPKSPLLFCNCYSLFSLFYSGPLKLPQLPSLSLPATGGMETAWRRDAPPVAGSLWKTVFLLLLLRGKRRQ